MATISKLSVQLAADTAPFSASMAGASKKLGSFASKVKSASGTGLKAFGSGLKTIATGLLKLGAMAFNAAKALASFAIKGALAAGAALAFFIKKELTAIDETVKLSKQLGISTSSLRAYGLAAELAGIDNATFEKSLQKFNRTLGEAKLGVGEGATAFKQLGLSQKEVSKLSPDDALNLVADSLSKVNDKAVQAALAQDLFGRAGVKLIPLLDKGAAGLAEFRKEADRLGITFNKIDAAKVEQANDAVTVLGKSFKGVFTQLAVKVAPFVQRFAEIITDAIVSFRQNTLPLIVDWVNQSIVKFRDFLTVALPVFFNFANGVADAISFVIDGFVEFGNFVGNIFMSFNREADGSKATFDDFIEGLDFGITFIRTAFENFGTVVDTVMFNIINSVANMVGGFIELIKKIPGVEKILDFSKAKGFDVEGFVKDIKKGSDALKEEAEDTLVEKFVANAKKNADRTKLQTEKFLNLFDKFAGFGKFKFGEIAIKDGVQQGVDIAAKEGKQKDLQAFEKGSAEAFRAINRPQQNAALNIAKAGVKQQEKNGKKLDKLVQQGRAEPILTVIPS